MGQRVELQYVYQRVAKVVNTAQQLTNSVLLTARQDEKLNAIEGAFHLAQASTDHARRVDPNSTILLFHCADADRLHRHSLR